MLSAVEHLHSNGIIYRDIKPENSVVDYKGKVYLIDMGTAKFLSN
jgi:serine/threonine protein kinase